MIYSVRPIYKEKIWGGRRIFDFFHRLADGADKVGESFEFSLLADSPTPLKGEAGQGKALKDVFDVPVLIKYIDARENLSVQVHPTAEYVGRHAGVKPKFEVWYVLEADKGAAIYCGFKRQTTREEVSKLIRGGGIIDILNRYEVQAGDFLFCPPGTVHAIGKGVLLCEVQQQSDTTFRMFDWSRGRELHIKEALDTIDYRKSEHLIRNYGSLYRFKTDYFDITIVNAEKESKLLIEDGIAVCVAAAVNAGGRAFNCGDIVIVSGKEEIKFEKNGVILYVSNFKE